MDRPGFFAHSNPDGVDADQRIQEASITCRATGENIAQNYWDREVRNPEHIESNKSLAEVIIQQWIDSPPHRENLFRASWDYVGHGIGFDGDKIYITQNFCGT
ncbi:CAP domain-containing protein [Halovenus sp. HT40]|uniref:CAP domain-containing protein n=1 Tax=Halovenus sp. HT40 TaxID=3126691 RepID=UPI003FA578DF